MKSLLKVKYLTLTDMMIPSLQQDVKLTVIERFSCLNLNPVMIHMNLT